MKLKQIALTLLLASSALAYCQDHFRFIVTGDDRWDTKAPRAGQDENGVNVAAMKRLAMAIIDEKPAILLFTGDCVGGAKTDEAETSQFQTFLTSMRPIYDSGVKVLMIRGNHEMHCPDADAVWRKIFTGPYANPTNGPKGEEDLTYSFLYGNTLFLGFDEFISDEPKVNQEWLEKVLAGNHATHIFAFAHKMAFKAGHHVDGLNQVPQARDRFLTRFANAGGRMIFFGHDHFYDHEVAQMKGWPESKSIHQVVAGTAGAPFVHGTSTEASDGDWALTHLGHVEDKLGYCVVDVDGSKVTVTFKGETSPGVFEPVDSFSYEEGK